MRYDKEGHPIVDNLDQIDGYIRERKRNVKNDKLFTVKDGQVKVDHIATANAMIHCINAVNMDKHIKEIMIMRIGSPAMNGVRMSHVAIALAKGMTEQEVIFMEKTGVKIMNEFLHRITLVDGARSNSSTSKPNEILEKVSKINPHKPGQRSPKSS